jgi:hypothetical protein
MRAVRGRHIDVAWLDVVLSSARYAHTKIFLPEAVSGFLHKLHQFIPIEIVEQGVSIQPTENTASASPSLVI